MVVGYQMYLDWISDLTQGKKLVSSGMKQEVVRVTEAVELVSQGHKVALVSSGDAGVYGMAGLAIELAQKYPNLKVKTIPGVTAANTAAASLGAPLMLDYAVMSLSDLLIPWEQIEKRLKALAQAGLVVALYNPKSTKRIAPFESAVDIFMKERGEDCFVGIVTDAGCAEEQTVITTLGKLKSEEVGMRSMVIVGNKETIVIGGQMLVPRGYKI